MAQYRIDRSVLTREELNEKSKFEYRKKTIISTVKNYFKKLKCLRVIQLLIPIVEWLPQYSCKYLVRDLFVGFTISVIQIPQGLAYAALAGVHGEVGLYMAFFPVLVYAIFGTSRQMSIGSFSTVALIVRKSVDYYSDAVTMRNSSPILIDQIAKHKDAYTPMEVITALSIGCGVIQIIMGILRLGLLSNILFDPLVNGFTLAAVIHLIIHQINDLLGIEIKTYDGLFALFYTIKDLILHIGRTNYPTLIFSSIVLLFLVIMNVFIRPWVFKKCKIICPTEFITILLGTIISKYAINDSYHIRVIGVIKKGLPSPKFPPIDLIIAISMIYKHLELVFVISAVLIPMGFVFAKKHRYKLRPNQELFAIGLCNLVGGIFSCMPSTCSISRSIIQDQAGGKTQLASVFSALIILLVLLAIGPVFEELPHCVLAGIIVIAMIRTLIMLCEEVKEYLNSKVEVFIWSITFLGVLILTFGIGLLLGLISTVIIFLFKSIKPHSCLKGNLPSPNSDLYVCLKHHKNASELPNMKIFHFAGSINFVSARKYKKSLYKLLNFKEHELKNPDDPDTFAILILDLSTVAYLDSRSCVIFTEIKHEMELNNIKLILSSPSDLIYNALSGSVLEGQGPFIIMPTIHDAVLLAQTWE